ncbi:TetR/AcrR family transcriptional regulator [Mycolicibacterium sp. CBMA 295]|uniref:TetR/AcrR family transcriptional regulator n=1 Tax=Mycolicibacterium sp. CBMA 295 TaxID=2606605 RepID=UPI001EE452A6|nr:TetR/AcrR family transcriptional regulator [Mycolicibacterium sp. CBMA 295]
MLGSSGEQTQFKHRGRRVVGHVILQVGELGDTVAVPIGYFNHLVRLNERRSAGVNSRVDGRTLRYQHRRPELLAAATEYVLDHGIGDLSLRNMARALGVTHATLLRHFSSKEDLILQVIAKIRSDFTDQLAIDEREHAALPWLLPRSGRDPCHPVVGASAGARARLIAYRRPDSRRPRDGGLVRNDQP